VVAVISSILLSYNGQESHELHLIIHSEGIRYGWW